MTSPRRRSNQRLAVIAASGTATAPVLEPITRPHSTYSCQGCVITVVSSDPTATITSAVAHTRRTPKRSITAAANGAPRPYTKRFRATAPPISSVDHPNSCCRGKSSTPVVARKPAAVTSTMKVAATTTHG